MPLLLLSATRAIPNSFWLFLGKPAGLHIPALGAKVTDPIDLAPVISKKSLFPVSPLGAHLSGVIPLGKSAEDAAALDRTFGKPQSNCEYIAVVTGKLLFMWPDDGIASCTYSRPANLHGRKRLGGNFYGSPIVAGEAVYGISAGGDAVVLAASEKYQLLARIKLGEGSNATPAVARKKLYLRTVSHLFCLDAD